jgi:hypothetical protein
VQRKLAWTTASPDGKTQLAEIALFQYIFRQLGQYGSQLPQATLGVAGPSLGKASRHGFIHATNACHCK